MKKMGNYRLFSHRYNNNHSISYLLDRKREMDSFICIDHFIDINIFDNKSNLSKLYNLTK